MKSEVIDRGVGNPAFAIPNGVWRTGAGVGYPRHAQANAARGRTTGTQRKRSIFRLIFLGALFLAGCNSMQTSRKVMPLDAFPRIFVVEELNDNHHLDALIVAELRRLGRDASSGPRTMMPDNTDAVVTY